METLGPAASAPINPAAATPIDPGALRLIRTISETGSLTAAARLLAISQPAVSQHVRRLERRLGTALIERSGRRIRLTEAGRILARHGASVSAAVEAAGAEVAALAGLRAGRVRVVAFPSLAATLLPAALALLRRRHPGLAVTFAEAEPPQALPALRAGRYDLAVAFDYPGAELGRGEDDLSGLVTRHLLADAVVIALPTGHPLAGRDTVAVAELADQTWITGCSRCRGHLLHACASAGFTPTIAYATDDYVAVLGLVAAGLGVAMLPGLVRPIAGRHPGVEVRPLDGTTPRQVYAVTTPDLAAVPPVAATLAALAEVAR